MIAVCSIDKFFGYGKRRQNVLMDLSFALNDGTSAVIYGLPGSGKTTLARIVSGLSVPNRGKVIRRGAVSIPIASTASLRIGKTPAHIAYVLASIYRSKKKYIADFIEDFGELHGQMDATTDVMSPESRMRLVYAMGYAVPAELYLVDGHPFRGNDLFSEKCRQLFEKRLCEAPFLCITSELDPGIIPGAAGAILHDGQIRTFERAEDAAMSFTRLQAEYARDILDHIRSLMRRGDLEEATALLEKIVTQEPTNSAAVDMLARIAWRRNDYRRVSGLSDALIAQTPQDPDLLIMSALAAERVGDFKQAVRIGLVLLENDPAHKKAGVLVAKCLEAQSEYSEAANIWLAMSTGELTQKLGNAARCLDLARDWDALFLLVMKCLNEKVSLNKNILQLGIKAAIEIKNFEGAATIVESLIASDPGRVFIVLTSYSMDLGPVNVANILEGLRAAGCNMDKDLLHRANLVSFLRRERREAALILSSEDRERLDAALVALEAV